MGPGGAGGAAPREPLHRALGAPPRGRRLRAGARLKIASIGPIAGEAAERHHEALVFGLEQDLGEGRKSQQVRLLDFDDPLENAFVVTRQYEVKGAKKKIVPDVVCLVNGIPLVVIECKSPSLGDSWKAEAIDQLDRYQEGSQKYKELGAPRLFQSVQLNFVTCGQDAVFGTDIRMGEHSESNRSMMRRRIGPSGPPPAAICRSLPLCAEPQPYLIDFPYPCFTLPT